MTYADRSLGRGPVRNPQLSASVAFYVRDLIMSGEVRSGEFLRVERIAHDMQVSVTPVREALSALRGEGFVTQEPHRGFVVLPLSAQDVEDLFEEQARVAGELAARAVATIDDRTLDWLDVLQDELEAAAQANRADEVERLNFQFHRIINISSGSRKLAWILSVLVRYAPRRFFANIPGWSQASVAEHRLIIEALRRRDAEQSRRAMEAHIVHAGSLLAKHLESRSGRGADHGA